MAYEVEALAPDFAPTNTQPVWRAEKVVDHKETARPVKKVEATAESGQVDTNEATAVTTKVSTNEEPALTLSPAAAALARREQKFRHQQAELKTHQEALATERQEIAELKALKGKLAAKDFSGIESLVSYDDYTNYLIEKSGTSTPEQQEIKSLREDVKKLTDAQKTDIDKRFEAAVTQRRTAVQALVESNSEFMSIKKMDAVEHVVQHILDTWEDEQVELSPEQAAKEVKEILLEQANRWSSILESKEAKQTEEKKPLPSLKPGLKTITNTMTATGNIDVPKRNYANMRSDEERWKAARDRVSTLNEKLKG